MEEMPALNPAAGLTLSELLFVPDWLGLLGAFVWGALWGSFLNVVIHRLPRGESLVRPASHCPACGHPVRPWDNVPLLSWLVLGGRCRDCRERISPRYPLVELMGAVLSAALYARYVLYGPSQPWLANLAPYLIFFAFSAALVAVIFIDLDRQIVPNEITLGGAAVGLLVTFLLPGVAWWESLLGIVLGGGFVVLVNAGYARLRGMQGMGMGDAKLLAMIGAFLGYRSLLFVLLVASLLGLLAVLLLGSLRRLTGRSRHLYDPASLQESGLNDPPAAAPGGPGPGPAPAPISAPAGAGAVEAGAVEAGAADAGAVDAGAVDAGAVDAGAVDAGAVDAGAVDAGAVDAGAVVAAAEGAGPPGLPAAAAAAGDPGPPPALPAPLELPLHRTAIAFGPYLALAAIAHLLAGKEITAAYTRLVWRLGELLAGG